MAKKELRIKREDDGDNWYVLQYCNGRFIDEFCPKKFERLFPHFKLSPGQSCRVTIDIRKVE